MISLSVFPMRIPVGGCRDRLSSCSTKKSTGEVSLIVVYYRYRLEPRNVKVLESGVQWWQKVYLADRKMQKLRVTRHFLRGEFCIVRKIGLKNETFPVWRFSDRLWSSSSLPRAFYSWVPKVIILVFHGAFSRERIMYWTKNCSHFEPAEKDVKVTTQFSGYFVGQTLRL